MGGGAGTGANGGVGGGAAVAVTTVPTEKTWPRLHIRRQGASQEAAGARPPPVHTIAHFEVHSACDDAGAGAGAGAEEEGGAKLLPPPEPLLPSSLTSPRVG